MRAQGQRERGHKRAHSRSKSCDLNKNSTDQDAAQWQRVLGQLVLKGNPELQWILTYPDLIAHEADSGSWSWENALYSGKNHKPQEVITWATGMPAPSNLLSRPYSAITNKFNLQAKLPDCHSAKKGASIVLNPFCRFIGHTFSKHSPTCFESICVSLCCWFPPLRPFWPLWNHQIVWPPWRTTMQHVHQQHAQMQIQLYAQVDTYWLCESQSQLNNVRVIFCWFVSTSLDVDQQDDHVTVLHWIFTGVCLIIVCMGCLQILCLIISFLILRAAVRDIQLPTNHPADKSHSTVLMVKLSNPYVQGPSMFALYPIFSAYTSWSLLYEMYISENIPQKMLSRSAKFESYPGYPPEFSMFCGCNVCKASWFTTAPSCSSDTSRPS